MEGHGKIIVARGQIMSKLLSHTQRFYISETLNYVQIVLRTPTFFTTFLKR